MISEKEHQLKEAINISKTELHDITQARVTAFHAELDEKWEEVKGWFDDRLEWADQLEDSYYKEHLKSELNEKFLTNMAIMQSHRALADEQAADANQKLWESMNEEY